MIYIRQLLILCVSFGFGAARSFGAPGEISPSMVFQEIAHEQLTPRLKALKTDLDSGAANALPSFWREVRTSGTPLLEAISDSTTETLMTLLWRAEKPTTSVIVLGGLNPDNKSLKTFTHLPGSDVWYKTWRVRSDLRTTYRLGPNDSLAPPETEQNWAARSATFAHDPLNPKSWLFDEPYVSKANARFSVIELPSAPRQPWVNHEPNTTSGTLRHHKLHSRLLGNERDVWTYAVRGSEAQDTSRSLLVFLDGEAYVSCIPTTTILNHLWQNREIAPCLTVFLANVKGRRSFEMPCNTTFTQFLASEFMPWINREYSIRPSPNNVTLVGSSYSGLAASFACLERPDLFGNALVLSGGFWWKPTDSRDDEWLTKQIRSRDPVGTRYYVAAGLLEISGDIIGGSRRFRDALRKRGYDVTYSEYNGWHDYICWQGCIADGLRALLPSAGRQALRRQ